jgi:hypothetical protein
MRTRLVLLLLVAGACSGGGSTPSGTDGGGACLEPGTTSTYCSTDSDCCTGGFCDPVTLFCRSDAQCGVALQWCSTAHPCCTGVTCQSTATCSGGGPE